MPDQNKAAVIQKSKLGTELTEQQCAVLSELVSISEYPDGEVRGRIVRDSTLARPGIIGLRARLNGHDEVISNEGTGKGEFIATYDPATRVLEWQLSNAGLTGLPTGIQLTQQGTMTSIGTNGARGIIKMTPAAGADLVAGLWGINVATAKAPGGEIQGNIVRAQ
jgi:hypothetical protein